MPSGSPATPSSTPPRRPRFGSSLGAKLALAICVPLVFFALLELGLRIGGYGRDPRFFIPDLAPGIYRSNPRFTELFLPASRGLKLDCLLPGVAASARKS